jgi:hypothetical protein
MGVGSLAKAPGKKHKLQKVVEVARYTDVITGVPGASVVLHGHHPRPNAILMARRHYEMVAARAHAALEALDGNKCAVRYRSGLDIVEASHDRDGAKASA